MSVALYMDVHVPEAITHALRLRSVDILTAQEDHADRLPDAQLLDAHLLREASSRQRSGIGFSGLIYAHQLNATIGQCVEDLEIIAKVCEPADLAGRVVYIPIR